MAQRMLKVQMDYALKELRNALWEKVGERPERELPLECHNDPTRFHAELLKHGEVDLIELMEEAIESFEQKHKNSRYTYTDVPAIFHDKLKRVLEELTPTPEQNPEFAVWEARKEKIEKIYKRAKDELILGDAGDALKMIERFRKIKV